MISITLEETKDQWLAVARDEETGSSTSISGRTVSDAILRSLNWAELSFDDDLSNVVVKYVTNFQIDWSGESYRLVPASNV